MKIKQVEELVGITSKNIRFYEEQGLLQPRRTENGYRDYRTEDVEKKLGVFGGAGIMLILMLLVIGVLIYGYVVDADMPLWALTLVIVPIVAVIVGTIVAMVSRIKEIDKGEEDEAAKY